MNSEKSLRVLFVEDSEDDMELLLAALRGEYDEIRHCRVDNAPALQTRLESNEWDVIVCDHNLPALDAPAALKILQETRNDIPFIIVSGLIGEDAAVAAMMAGAADIIDKNNLSRLVPAIKREIYNASTIRGLKKANEHIDRIAYHDQVTALPNREYLAGKVGNILVPQSSGTEFALAVINVNRFSQIHKSFGIEVGNQVLKSIGERLSQSIGEEDIAARIGGDRFAVLLPGTDDDARVRVMDTITKNMSKVTLIDSHELFLSSSVGISVYPRDGQVFDELLMNAETAMHEAYSNGGCNCRFFDQKMNASSRERFIMEHALHRALMNEEFLLHYQPQIDAQTGMIVGVEALLRWQHPIDGLVSPANFVPVLEETGMILSVGEWVLRTACTQNRRWQQAGLPPFRVAVNLSAIQFQQSNLVEMVRRVLDETGLAPHWLELEITESIAMFNEEATIATLAELKAMGIHLAIDDFGTGYSSLSYLNRFPVHKLKIDRSFINDISDDNFDSPIVKSIILLAKNFKLKVIAEGVETSAQFQFLRDCGCDEIQGYLFSKPLPGDSIGSLHRSKFGNEQFTSAKFPHDGLIQFHPYATTEFELNRP